MALACGGGAGAEPDGPPRARSAALDVATEPVAVDVSASRVGEALRLDIEAIGRGARAGAPFEDPARWTISARQRDQVLQRLVNGPVKVARQPAGATQWDTVVRFSVVYRVDGAAGDVRVRIAPPDEPAIERVFRL